MNERDMKGMKVNKDLATYGVGTVKFGKLEIPEKNAKNRDSVPSLR